jgi:hypothetical protein
MATAVSSGVARATSAATGRSLTGVTVMLTVATVDSRPWASVVRNVNESLPWKLAAGV